jgi:hypothetical protein
MTQEQLRMQMLAGIITEGEYKQKLSENENSIGIGKQPILTPKQQKEYEDSLIKMFYDDLNDPYEGGGYSAVYNLSYNTELIIANLLSGYKPLNDDWWGQEDWNWESDDPKHPYNILKSKGYDLEEIKDLMDSKLKAFERNSTNNPKIKDIQSYIKAASD